MTQPAILEVEILKRLATATLKYSEKNNLELTMEKISNFPGNLEKIQPSIVFWLVGLSSPPLWLCFRPAVLRKRH